MKNDQLNHLGHQSKPRNLPYLLVKIGLATFYLLTWFLFGVLYRSAANSSYGRDFIFQEDIRTMSHVAAFKQKFNVKLPDSVIIDLIRAPSQDNIFLTYPCSKDTTCWVSNKAIGLEWANYYERLFESRGITRFALRFEGRVEHPLASMPKMSKQLEDLPHDCVKVTLSLFRNSLKPLPDNYDLDEGKDRAIRPLDPEDDKNLTLVGEYTIWRDIKPFASEASNRQGGPIPITALHYVLQDSLNLIDNSIGALDEIVSGKFTYPLTDFLYFSAITITTTGYGDILPRTARIRTLVMIETLLGIITIGAFISSLFLGYSPKIYCANCRTDLLSS